VHAACAPFLLSAAWRARRVFVTIGKSCRSVSRDFCVPNGHADCGRTENRAGPSRAAIGISSMRYRFVAHAGWVTK
ncbi:MAG: hypothetical protein V4793_35190, partial [Paraburkholderia tropica]